MKVIVLVVLYYFAVTGAFAQDQNELVQLYTDKSVYTQGETLFFTTAISDLKSDQPAHFVKLLHAFVYDWNGSIVWNGKFEVHQGVASGSIDLINDGVSFDEGSYYLSVTTVNSPYVHSQTCSFTIVNNLAPRFVSSEEFEVSENERDLQINLNVRDQFNDNKNDITVKMMVAGKNGYPKISKSKTDESGNVTFKLRRFDRFDFSRIEFIFYQNDLKSTKVVHRSFISDNSFKGQFKQENSPHISKDLNIKKMRSSVSQKNIARTKTNCESYVSKVFSARQSLDVNKLFDLSSFNDGRSKMSLKVYRKGYMTDTLIADTSVCNRGSEFSEIKGAFRNEEYDRILSKFKTDDITISTTMGDDITGKHSLPDYGFYLFSDNNVIPARTDAKGKLKIDAGLLEKIKDDRLMASLNPSENVYVEIKDFHHELLESKVFEKISDFLGRYHFNHSMEMTAQEKEFYLKNGLLDQVELGESKYFEVEPPKKNDYVCHYNILNCPNHKSGRPAMDGQVYYTLVQSGSGTALNSITYRNPDASSIEKNVQIISGISSSKEFDNSGREELMDSFHDLRRTICWYPFTTYNSKQPDLFQFAIADVPGTYIAELYVFDLNGAITKCATEFIVN